MADSRIRLTVHTAPTSTNPRPAHRADTTRASAALADAAAAIAALAGGPRVPGRHVAPASFEVRLERDLRPHGYSVARLVESLDAGGAR